MTESRVIPIKASSSPLVVPLSDAVGYHKPIGGLHDLRGRLLHDLRISVTDRCNFRCSYCMPKEVFDKNYVYLPHQALLSFEEILRLAKAFVALGVQKIRLTGGEPLLRKDIEVLVGMLAQLRTPQGEPLDLTLTTNGTLLAKKAAALKAAGLKRVTISLDALDDTVFKRMNDMNFSVHEVLSGIAAARQVGWADKPGALKVNMVVKKGVNDDQIVPMAQFFKGQGISLRFIEYMDVGSTNGWRMDEVLPSKEVLNRLRKHFSLVPAAALAPGETAQRWVHTDQHGKADPYEGEIGLISSVTQAFCRDCNRARLSTEGRLFLCLFAHQGYDLKPFVRGESALCAATGDEALTRAIAGVWQQRDDHYSETRSQFLQSGGSAPKVEMSYIGG